MTSTSKEISDLLKYFSVQNSSNHILSLALTANDTLVEGLTQQTITLEQPYWNLLETENTSTSLLFNYFNENSSAAVQYATNNTFGNRTKISIKSRTSTEIPIWLIPCYSIILIFAVIGNLLVASTLFQNRRMRTITNVFLVNLAISDMLLGVLCMPITLVGTYLRHFIFGELVCKFIQFAQAASVAVSSWTLVAISCERYYAICHPLRSRTWQTIHHAYKIIGCIWFGSIICMAPIAIFSQLIPTSRQGLRKCREQWPKQAVAYERCYNIFLDLVLLVLPLVILCVAYILITRTLYMGIRDEKALIFGGKNNNTNFAAAGDAKIYTQVETEMKTPTVFHLNMSFRYHQRKGVTSAVAGSNVNNGESIRVMKTSTTNTSTKRKETEFFTNSTDVENKYSAIQGSISSTAVGTAPECNEADTEHQQQSTNLQNSQAMLLPQRCNDSLTSTPMTPTMATAKIRKLKTKSFTKLTTAHFSRSAERRASCYQKQQHLQHNHAQMMQFHQQQKPNEIQGKLERRKFNSTPSLRITESTLRRSNIEKNLESKKRVVKMLFVLVLEFFICWTPLYVINTVAMFIGPAIYEYVDYTTISFFQLLAYSSSCCNPITYCFMNASFRRAFVDTFKDMHCNGISFWHKSSKNDISLSMAGNSIALANSYTVNSALGSPRL